MEKRKVLEIPEEFREKDWKSHKVTIKRLSLPEQLRLRDRATQARITEAGLRGSVSQEAAGIGLLVMAVVEAPWPTKDPRAYEQIDGAFGQWLISETQAFQTLSEKKNLKSGTKSKQEDGA